MKPNQIKKARRISRRQFLSLAAAGALAAACSPVQPPAVAPTKAPAQSEVEGSQAEGPAEPPAPTAAPAPAVAAPTDTPTPAAATATPAPPLSQVEGSQVEGSQVEGAATGRPEVIKFYPSVPSKVVHTHHAGVWSGDQLSPDALRQMLDASITKLTGLDDAKSAWAALFKPTEKVAIKVNTFNNSTIWTHVLLTKAVVASLQDAGLPPEQIFIYDSLSVFKDAGYEVNKDGPGVRCINETKFSGKWKVGKTTADLSDTLQSCDALINMPVLKAHMIAGLTFALKNHYGTVSSPGSLHSPIDRCVAELNAMAPIKEKTRLVVGDVLEANLKYNNSWPYWEPDWRGDSILMSFDPVALDTIGMQMLEQLQTEKKVVMTGALKKKATSYLNMATELGLGANDPKNMEVMEVKLG